MEEIIRTIDLNWITDEELMNLYYMAVETQKKKYIVLLENEKSRRHAE